MLQTQRILAQAAVLLAFFGVGACVPPVPPAAAPLSVASALAPAVVAQTVSQELIERQYEIVRSDATGGLVIARRVSSPSALFYSIACGYRRGSISDMSYSATHTVTVTARQADAGSQIGIRSQVRVDQNGAGTSDTDCVSKGTIETALANAVAPSAVRSSTPVPPPPGGKPVIPQRRPIVVSSVPVHPVVPPTKGTDAKVELPETRSRPDTNRNAGAGQQPRDADVIAALRGVSGSEARFLAAFCGLAGTSPGATFRIQTAKVLRRGQHNASEKFWPYEVRIEGMCNASAAAQAMLGARPTAFASTVQLRFSRDDMGDPVVRITKVLP